MKKSQNRETPLRRLYYISLLITLAFSILVSCVVRTSKEARFPGTTWGMYTTAEEAGWSSFKLSKAKELYDESDSDAFLVVYDGAVLVAWGDISRRYMCHSVRKSFLSALIGIHVNEGRIDLEKTLEELNIDDEPPLTKDEKQARIIDLLQSRSGVYHAAAYETPKMKEQRPERGSKKPGEFWYYNNWDFNTLCTIFEQETRAGMFAEFKRRIADPLRMEDFRLMDTYYHLEKQLSILPAYPFRMSARDMARFGLLFLRNGRWKNLSIIPEKWVGASRRAYSKVPQREGEGYGYMWWVNVDERDRKFGMYSALGYGGHMIAVLPKENMVFVNRSNTYLGEGTDRTRLLQLIDAILEAKDSPPSPQPHLVPLQIQPDRPMAEPDFPISFEDYEESFRFDNEEIFASTIPYVIGDMIGQRVRIEVDRRRLLMIDNLGQKFYLIPRSPTEFLVEDMEIPVLFELDDRARPIGITLNASPAWRISGERTSTSSLGSTRRN
ncbi:MAG: serine hydrolase [Gemmatimonadota bacterium]|nr:MAG: serine hydrolase [Gemmatimonadota bacterium]